MKNSELFSRTGFEFDDKCYLTCKVDADGLHAKINIDPDSPVAWLNQAFKDKYGSPSDYTVAEMKEKPEGLSLLSAGIFLSYKDKLVVFERDQGAPSYAGFMTEPAGRCDTTPYNIAMREFNEELLITQKGLLGSAHLAFHHHSFEKGSAVAIKRDQTKDGIGVKTIYAEFEPSDKSYEVHYGDKLMENAVGFHWMDKKNNTLEIRQTLKLDDSMKISSIVDGEPYGRKVEMKSMKELFIDDKMTPCLDHYVNSEILKNDKTFFMDEMKQRISSGKELTEFQKMTVIRNDIDVGKIQHSMEIKDKRKSLSM